MPDTIDTLQIDISANNSKAINSINSLCTSLDRLNTKLNSGLKVASYVSSVNAVKTSLDGVNTVAKQFNTQNVKNMTDSLVGLSKTLGKFGNKKPTQASANLTAIANSFNSLMKVSSGSTNPQGFSDVANSISRLGGKNAERAITNLPLLTQELKNFIETMSKLPNVSDNVIQVTNALTNLASQGGKIRTATNGLKSYYNTINANQGNSKFGLQNIFDSMTIGSNKATKGMKSLSYYFGKFYASYFLVLRAFNGFKKAIDFSSDLTEVQNVVDNVFGDARNQVEDFSKSAIQNFGMSILTSKKVASEFQAMGNAMGITNQQVKDSNATWTATNEKLQETGQGYDNLADSMADMSLNLTKLASDMGSFYNQDYEDVAERLASGIMTGQSRVLRQYGLDLTQATIQEWALSRGLEANMKTMTQAEKTMLRYQYVMANTQNIQGDFLRTATSWANVVRVLAQNFQNLGATIGGITINAFRPFLIALNNGILKLNEFAIAISNSLGKIFGWTYQSGGGAVSSLEDMEDSAGGLADNLGDAGDNAKKLKSQLQGFDNLNVLSSDNNSGSGSSGSGSGGASGGASGNNGGQWVQTESMFESQLDTLGKLGTYISDKLSEAMESIDWDSIYQGAKNFGTGLAEFLNGLITPRLFYDVGTTVANSLNTAIYTALAFGEEFDFNNFGESIASSINGFFQNFDFTSLAETLNVWVDGFFEILKGFFDNLDWDSLFEGLEDFVKNLEIDTLTVVIGALAWKLGVNGIAKKSLEALLGSTIATGIGGSTISLGATVTLSIIVGLASLTIGNWAYNNISLVHNWSDEVGKWIFGENYDNSKLEVAFRVFALTFGNFSSTIGGVKINTFIIDFVTDCADLIKSTFKTSLYGLVLIISSISNAVAIAMQPMLDIIADLGEKFGVLDKDTADSMRNFKDNVYNATKKAKEDFNTLDSPVSNAKKSISDFNKETKKNLDATQYSVNQTKSKFGDLDTSIRNNTRNINSDMQSMSDSSTKFKDTATSNNDKVKQSTIDWKNAINSTKTSTSSDLLTMSNNTANFAKNANTNFSKGKSSANFLKDALNDAKNSAQNLNNQSGKTFNVNTGSGVNSLSTKLGGIADSIVKIFNFSGRTFSMNAGNTLSAFANIFKKADGGVFYEGSWHSIPQYASGGIPSSGTMFVAGEAGAEAVGHINGRTEVLNESQMASVMYNAVLSGMSAAMARSGNNNVTVTLEGDAKGVFNLVRKQDKQYRNINGHSAFGY